jgi:D-lyxose ketol-isomerase
VARYFFHTNHPAELIVQDDEGFDFANIHEAKCAAVKYAGQLLADVGEHFWDIADFDLTVTDERGLILFSMRVIGIEAPAIRTSGSHSP